METVIIIAIAAMCLTTIGSLTVLGILFAHLVINPLKPLKNDLCTSPQPGTDGAGKTSSSGPAAADDEEAKRRFKEEEEAFQKLMSYNAEIAYSSQSMLTDSDSEK